MPEQHPEDQTAPAPLWPLSDLEVRGLFGAGNLSIALDSDASILTGENGSGKSTILRAIHLLGQGQWRLLAELPLDFILLRFTTDEALGATLDRENIELQSEAGDTWKCELDQVGVASRWAREEQMLLRRVEEATASERRALLNRLAHLRRRIRDEGRVQVEVPSWVSERVDRIQTRLVSARRLEHRLRPEDPRPGEDAPLSVVDQFSEALGERMQRQLSAYAAESRRKEKRLPSQIVRAMQAADRGGAEALASDVDQLVSDVRRLADSLTAVGLLYEAEDPDPQLAEYPRDDASILLAVREVYRVTLERLESLSALRAELELFAGFLNERFTNKQIELNQEEGIEVVLDGGERIRPSQLSSGEQQLLALAYEILFQAEPGSIVLLDEPELSLHVAWLKGLIGAFLEMGQERELQFLIATHSPSVLAGHTAWERSLDELVTYGAT